MRNSWLSGIAPLACAAVMAACGGSDDRREEQPIQDRMAQAPQQMTLTGCVQLGQLETDFALQNARINQTTQQSQNQGQDTQGGQTPTGGSAGLREYSLVQLRAENPADLRQYVGQEVRVTGLMTDTGANTIGTAGVEGTHEAPSGDKSMAAASDRSHSEKVKAEAGRIARETMANGTAPIVRVQKISPTGQKCAAPGREQ